MSSRESHREPLSPSVCDSDAEAKQNRIHNDGSELADAGMHDRRAGHDDGETDGSKRRRGAAE
jgi:hypothetical protein